MAKVCAAELREAGLKVQVVASDEALPNVVGTLRGRSSSPVLAYHAHMDTVPVEDPSNWEHDPFGGQLVDGAIYGRGAGDDKGSVAAQIAAVKALTQAGVEFDGTIVVCLVADEEQGGLRGTKWLRDQGYLRPDLLIIGEQTDNRVAIAERSMVRFEIVARGVAAHGAMPWEGVNAIVSMASLICHLEDTLGPILDARMHPYLPHSSMNIGTIEGGLKPNMVPEICTIRMDRRLLPAESPSSAEAEMRNVLESYSAESEDSAFELKEFARSWPAVSTDPEEELVKVMQSVIVDLSGDERPLTGYNQGSDSRFFAEDGIPVVICGPSDPAVGHAPNEHVTVKSLVEAARIYALTAIRLLSGHV
jgi:acetylornithine deacetylase/succinyl-diaminopimelate desuccinylase family protein